MNRREVLSALTAAVGATGLKASVDVVASEPKPMLAVITCERSLPAEAREAISRAWNRLRELEPGLPPCVVMDHGLKLEIKTHGD